VRSYDLLLQVREPHAVLQLEAVIDALSTRGLTRRGEQWAVVLPSREVEVSALREGGVPIALELRVPLDEDPSALEEAIAWAVDSAKAVELRLLDPQLGVVLTGPSSATTDSFLRAARYSGELVGVSGVHQGTTFGTRMLLAAVVFLVFLWGAFRVVGAPRASAPPPAASRSR
jgi:hypothetical protein